MFKKMSLRDSGYRTRASLQKHCLTHEWRRDKRKTKDCTRSCFVQLEPFPHPQRKRCVAGHSRRFGKGRKTEPSMAFQANRQEKNIRHGVVGFVNDECDASWTSDICQRKRQKPNSPPKQSMRYTLQFMLSR